MRAAVLYGDLMLSLAEQLKGLTPQQKNKRTAKRDDELSRILALLRKQEDYTPGQIAEKLGYTHNAVLKYLTILRDRGCVYYYRSGPLTRVALTPEEKGRGTVRRQIKEKQNG